MFIKETYNNEMRSPSLSSKTETKQLIFNDSHSDNTHFNVGIMDGDFVIGKVVRENVRTLLFPFKQWAKALKKASICVLLFCVILN